jgi:hypothetical protein
MAEIEPCCKGPVGWRCYVMSPVNGHSDGISASGEYIPGDRHEIPLKRRTAELLNLPKEAPASKVLLDVTGILSKWKIERFRSALYVPNTFTLHLQGSAEEAELLRSVIFLLEQGAVIKFPD